MVFMVFIAEMIIVMNIISMNIVFMGIVTVFIYHVPVSVVFMDSVFFPVLDPDWFMGWSWVYVVTKPVPASCKCKQCGSHK